MPFAGACLGEDELLGLGEVGDDGVEAGERGDAVRGHLWQRARLCQKAFFADWPS